MESSNWRSAQGEPSSMEAPSADWRSQLQPGARQRIVNKIMDSLKRHLPVVGPEGVGELKKIALRFEEKIYSAAVNQSDYLRRIAMKMFSMETKTQQNTSMISQPGISQNSSDTEKTTNTHEQTRVEGEGSRRRKRAVGAIALAVALEKLADSIEKLAVSVQCAVGTKYIDNVDRVHLTLTQMPDLDERDLLRSMDILCHDNINYDIFMRLPDKMKGAWLRMLLDR